jgi:hypothetical protein
LAAGDRCSIAVVKPTGLIGVILIIVGIVGFAWGGIHWSTEKKDAQLGPLEIKHTENQGINFPPIVSGICLVGGIALVAIGARKT